MNADNLTALREYELSSASVRDSTKSRRRFGRFAYAKVSNISAVASLNSSYHRAESRDT